MFAHHADAFPWAWRSQMLAEWLGDLRSVRGLRRSTIRKRLLDDGAGRISPPLQPFATALLDTPRLEVARQYLYKPHAVELLTALASGRLPLTHDALNGWPRAVAAQQLRHKLIASGVLPPVDGHLANIEVWLLRRLSQLTGHPHERLLRQFALWHQLPRLRATAAARPLRANAKQYVTQQFTQAQVFLTWLHDNTIDPGEVTQANLDAWYATHRVHQRQLVRGFLCWAIDHGHLPPHLVPHRVAFKPGTVITQQRRGLTAADLIDADGELLIQLGDPPTPVPDPFADLLRRLAATAPASEPRWLFPGQLAGQPLAYATLSRRMRQLGFPLIDARVSAIRQLVLQAPAPVVADALGFHQTSTARQVANAGGTWSRYTRQADAP